MNKDPYFLKKLGLDENSLCAQFITTGERPQNFIKNTQPHMRFREYPKVNALIQQKSALIKMRNHPPVYIKQDLRKMDLTALGRFDVILIDPPWEEYEKRAKYLPSYLQKQDKYKSWSLEDLMKINIESIAESPSFVFLWVGSEHLDDGRDLFKKWGFKRCEDIVWIKTNKKNKDCIQPSDANPNSVLQRVKEHCLVGLKGDTKRASDSTFIHPNIDIDVIVDEEPEAGSLRKPEEIYDIIERFCLGRRRLELFGENHNIRPGWLTIGKHLNETNYIQEEYSFWFLGEPSMRDFRGGRYTGTNNAIQSLRPKESAKQPKDNNKLMMGNNSLSNPNSSGNLGGSMLDGTSLTPSKMSSQQQMAMGPIVSLPMPPLHPEK